MARLLRGKVWRFEGILDVDWEIVPVQKARAFSHGEAGLDYSNSIAGKHVLEGLGQLCLTVLDPDFPKKVRPGDFVVGGEGTGYGHDHDQASMALRGAGVGAVLCEAANTNFKRNSIHVGLPVVEVKGIMDKTKTGDTLEVDLAAGTVKNLDTSEVLHFQPYPDFILEILDEGGIYAQVSRRIKKGAYSR